MHRSQAEVAGPIGIFFPEEVSTHFAQTEEIAEPILILFVLHTLKFFDEFRINPVTICFNNAN